MLSEYRKHRPGQTPGLCNMVEECGQYTPRFLQYVSALKQHFIMLENMLSIYLSCSEAEENSKPPLSVNQGRGGGGWGSL